MKSLAIFAAITLLGAVVLFVATARHEPAHEQPAAAPTPATGRAAVRPALASRPAAPEEPRLEPKAAPERTADTAIADRRAQLQAQFAGQPVDTSWATQARQQLRDDLGKFANAEVRVRDVECRSSLCRIELAAANHDAQQSFVESWVRYRTWTGSGFAVQDGDATIVYVSKPGVDLPGDVASAR